jgi:GAF domain-containing protein
MSNTGKLEIYLDAIRETAHLLSSVLQESELVQILLDQVVAVLPVEKALVLLPGRDAKSFLLAGATGLSDSYLEGMSTPLYESPINRRVLAGETLIVSDIRHVPDFDRPGAANEGVSGLAAVPMSVRGRVIGVLHVYGNMKSIINQHPDFQVLLGILADLGGLALEKVRLHQSLFRISEVLSSTMDLHTMLQKVLENTVEEMWLKAASIRLLDDKTQILRLAAAYGLSESYLTKGEIHLSKSEVDRRALEGEDVVLFDVGHQPGFEYPTEAAKHGILSVLVVPLKVKDRTHGVMRVYSAQPRRFGPVAITFLKSVAYLVCLAMENANLYAALQERCNDLKQDLADWHRFLVLG